jgi:hypothetical protein
MALEVSLGCSQDVSTGSYPEPDQSSSYHQFISLKHPFWHPSTYFRIFLVGPFFLAFSPKSNILSYSPPCLLNDLPIPFSLTSSFYFYFTNNTNYKAPHFVVPSNVLSLHPSMQHILLSSRLSNIFHGIQLYSLNSFKLNTFIVKFSRNSFRRPITNRRDWILWAVAPWFWGSHDSQPRSGLS